MASVAHTPLLIFCYLIGKLKHFRQKYGMLWSSNMLSFHFIKRDEIPGNRGCVHAEEAGRGSFVSRARERGSPSLPRRCHRLSVQFRHVVQQRPPTSEAVIELRPPLPPPPTSALSRSLRYCVNAAALSRSPPSASASFSLALGRARPRVNFRSFPDASPMRIDTATAATSQGCWIVQR